ncbi:MAG: DUF3488 and transglutaminase-like domain-containing protein [Myxococcota bacterium]
MKFHSLHAFVSYLLAGLGLIALMFGSELPLMSGGLLAIGYLASLFVGPSVWDRPGYTRLWNGILLTFLALQVARGFFFGSPILTLGIEFAGGLQVSRLFHRRSARDYQHIQALAFLHLIAATVLSTGIEYGAVFFGFVLATPWMLAFTHLRSEIENHYGEGIDNPGPRARRVLASRRIAGPGFLFGTAALSLPLFVVTAAFFLLFPRVGMGFLSFGDAGGRRVAGFGGNVELGDFGVIRNDPTVVVRVRPTDGVAPPRGFYRLRGTSFDRYEDSRWTRSPALPQRFSPSLGYHLIQRSPRGQERELDIVLDPLDDPVIFLPEGTIALRIPPRVENALDVRRSIQRRPGLDVRYVDGDGLAFRYTALIADDARSGIPELLEDEQRERYLQLPPISARLRALAEEKAGEGTPRERARRLETWLGSSGEFAYSLEMPDTSGGDPLEIFLFDARRGHCEYYSTALAVMLRAIGIPSRNVTGFVGGRWNEYGGYYAVSQGDAHSWVEAWIDGQWETFDPTPAGRQDLTPEDDWLAEVRAVLDALRTRWSEDVVGYDLRRQIAGLRSFYRWLRSFRSDEAEVSNEPEDRDVQASTGPEAKWAVGIAIVPFVLVALIYAWRRRRPGRPKNLQEATKVFADLEAALRRQGHPRPAGRTPKEHAKIVEASGFAASDAVWEVTHAYLAARFGSAPLDVAAARRRVREVRRAR